MAYTSFTIEAWMYAQSLCNGGCWDNALFGQLEQNAQDRSIHFVVRQQRIYMGFFGDDLQGNLVSPYQEHFSDIVHFCIIENT